jgi:hypothetical protein
VFLRLLEGQVIYSCAQGIEMCGIVRVAVFGRPRPIPIREVSGGPVYMLKLSMAVLNITCKLVELPLSTPRRLKWEQEWSGQLDVPATLRPGKYPLHRRQSRHQESVLVL